MKNTKAVPSAIVIPKNPLRITQIVLHKQPHLDEVAALFLLYSFGETLFPDIKKAEVRFTDHGVTLPDAEYDRDGVLPIGCGGGRFDEHLPTGRLPGECATTLVAKYLGVTEIKSLKPILDEVLRCDTEGGVKNTELAEVVKFLNRQITPSPSLVVKWVLKALEAMYIQSKYNYTRVTGELTLLEIFEKFAGRTRYEAGRAYDSVFRFLKGSQTRKDVSLSELGHVTECLYRTLKHEAKNDEPNETEEWVLFALDRLYKDQEQFWRSVEEVKEKGQKFQVPAEIKGRDYWLSAVMIHSDDQLVSRAARTKDAGDFKVVILRNTKGQVQVFIDSSVPGLSLRNFAGMVRFLDLPLNEKKGGIDEKKWVELTSDGEGNNPAVKHWHFFKGMLLNGSNSHPGVKPTGIASPAIVEVAKHAFDPRGFESWTKYRNIRVPKRAEQQNNTRSQQNTHHAKKGTTAFQELAPVMDEAIKPKSDPEVKTDNVLTLEVQVETQQTVVPEEVKAFANNLGEALTKSLQNETKESK